LVKSGGAAAVLHRHVAVLFFFLVIPHNGVTSTSSAPFLAFFYSFSEFLLSLAGRRDGTYRRAGPVIGQPWILAQQIARMTGRGDRREKCGNSRWPDTGHQQTTPKKETRYPVETYKRSCAGSSQMYGE